MYLKFLSFGKINQLFFLFLDSVFLIKVYILQRSPLSDSVVFVVFATRPFSSFMVIVRNGKFSSFFCVSLLFK